MLGRLLAREEVHQRRLACVFTGEDGVKTDAIHAVPARQRRLATTARAHQGDERARRKVPATLFEDHLLLHLAAAPPRPLRHAEGHASEGDTASDVRGGRLFELARRGAARHRLVVALQVHGGPTLSRLTTLSHRADRQHAEPGQPAAARRRPVMPRARRLSFDAAELGLEGRSRGVVLLLHRRGERLAEGCGRRQRRPPCRGACAWVFQSQPEQGDLCEGGSDSLSTNGARSKLGDASGKVLVLYRERMDCSSSQQHTRTQV
mmetsp:Transcript_46135/g.149899  ORF Transcript_46135/g.149899 Transcript_46135/m.149899 type:complete len:263 (-) Transcript_46135:410-1198(-)